MTKTFLTGMYNHETINFFPQVRNLEFIFAEAVSQGCKHIVTGGGPQSGLCRAVALTARTLGLVPHVVIEGVEKVLKFERLPFLVSL